MVADQVVDLLEREEQLATLVAAVERARRGDGGTVALVTGEAGAGKSTLVRALAAAIAPRRVATGWCDLLATPRPLGPLLDIARTELRTIPIDGGIADVGATVLDLLAVASSPVLVVEDLHWADAATLDLVRHLARRIQTTRGVVVVTCRDDEVGPSHPVAAVLGDVAACPGVVRVEVPLLSRAATAALLEGTDLDADEVHAVTGGNPFFVTEVAALGTLRPPGAAAAVVARLDRLDRDPRILVEVVSLSPRLLEVDVATRVAGVDVAALDRALEAGVLVERGGGVGFRHELARAAVEASLPVGRRRTGHRRLLAVLEEGGVDDLARLVHHAINGDDAASVRRLGPVAAAQALGRGAPWQAAAFLEAALDALASDDVARSVELRIELVEALHGLDRVDEQVAIADVAVADARTLRAGVGSPLLGRALTQRALASFWSSTPPEDPLADLEEAIPRLEQAGDVPWLAAALRIAAVIALERRHRAGVEAFLSRLAPVVDRLGDEAVHERYARLQAWADLVLGNAERGERALRSAMEGDHTSWQEDVLNAGVLGSAAAEVRRYAIARVALARAAAIAEQFDAHGWADLDRAGLALVALATGRLDEAVVLGRAAVDGAAECAIRATGLAAVGRALTRRGGADDDAEDALQRAVDAGQHCQVNLAVPAVCGLVELQWTRGELDAPTDALRALHADVLQTDSEWLCGETSWWLWRLGEAGVEPDRCAAPYALQLRGRWQEAAAAWHAIGAPWEEAMVLVDGGPEDRLRALRILEGIGAFATADLVRAWLRREDDLAVVPRGPSRATRANPAGLTPRQLEVLELVVAGLDNAGIAARLHLSKRTVEHHVGAVFAKLGVGDRQAAAAVARTLGVGG